MVLNKREQSAKDALLPLAPPLCIPLFGLSRHAPPEEDDAADQAGDQRGAEREQDPGDIERWQLMPANG
jgi:hypothetical protein